MLSRLMAYLRAFRQRKRIDAEVDDELGYHLEMETQANQARGFSPAEARRVALRDLGGVTQTREAVQAERAIWVGAALRDLRYAFRRMGRERGLTAAVLLTLALGIGANSGIFALADPMLLRSLPYPQADRIVTMSVTGKEVFFGPNVADYLPLERESTTVELVSTFSSGPRGYLGETADRLAGMRVSPNFLQLFGVQPAAGRRFAPEEYSRNARIAPRVAIISWSLWQSAFGGRDDVVGSRLKLTADAVRAGTPITVVSDLEIVGVLPRRFVFPDGRAAQPAFLVPADVDPSWSGVPTQGVPILARLRDGADPGRAAAELEAICRITEDAYSAIPRSRVVGVTRLQESLFGDLQHPLMLLFAAAATVLLLSYVNLAHLMMAATSARAREMTVRRSLGAGTGRLVWLAIAEAGCLCFVGTIGGLVVGQGILHWVMSQTPEFGFVYRVVPAGLDLRGVIFSAALALVGLMVMAAWPAWRLRQADARPIAGAPRRARGRGSEAAWLIGFQAAFTVAILAAGTLTVKSFAVLAMQSRGFDPAGIKSLSVRLPPAVLADPDLSLATYRRVADAIAGVPGVVGAGVVASVPGMLISGAILDTAGQRIDDIWVHRVSGGFPAIAGMRLEEGRLFSDDEAFGAAAVAIVDRRTADRLWPGQPPLGQSLRDRTGRTLHVVGVVSTVSQVFRQGVAQPGLVLMPFHASERNLLTVVAQFEASMPAGAIRDVARRIDDRIVIGNTETHVTYERFVGQPRFLATVVGSFGVLAGLLAVSGVFAVASHVVLRRRREIAVRLALGATTVGMRRLILKHAVAPALAGVAIGVTAAFWWTKALESVLVGVTPRDWSSYVVAVCLALVAITLGAALPAIRASRVDPAVTLRSE